MNKSNEWNINIPTYVSKVSTLIMDMTAMIGVFAVENDPAQEKKCKQIVNHLIAASNIMKTINIQPTLDNQGRRAVSNLNIRWKNIV